MSKPELGVKRDCPECGARFYDLNKEPAHCPKCAHEFIPEALLKPRKPRATEEGSEETDEKETPTSEVSLSDAEKENKAPESNRKAGLDEEEEDELAEFEDVDLDDDNEDDDTLLDNDDDDSDVVGIVTTKDDDES